jgi:hypothetical protein
MHLYTYHEYIGMYKHFAFEYLSAESELFEWSEER